MSLTEVSLLARGTWFIGAILFAMGFVNSDAGLLVGSALAMGGSLISMAIMASKPQ